MNLCKFLKDILSQYFRLTKTRILCIILEVSIKVSMLNGELLQCIQNSLFLEEDLKHDLITYFDSLTQRQIAWLILFFQNEKKYITQFLQTLQHAKPVDFFTIKTQMMGFLREKIHTQELLERQEETAHLDGLFDD